MKEIVLITGAAGSGLSSAEIVFEELGYFTMKNVVPEVVETILKGFFDSRSKTEKLCIVTHSFLAMSVYENLKKAKDVNLRLIVLSCSYEQLEKRYALSRRIHPRTVLESITAEEAFNKDIEDVGKLIAKSDLTIDTTSIAVKQLRTILYEYVGNVEKSKITHVTFLSFGIKNGIPQGIDAMFDVRAIPNPYWVEGLRDLNGTDKKVIDYMEGYPITQEIIDNIILYIKKYFKSIKDSARANYTIGIACSGGQHRSTFVANYLKKYFENEMRTSVIHRDCPELNKDEE